MANQIESQSQGGGGGGGNDRRSNLVLRALIDEMLERVRELNRNTGEWTPDERTRAESELDAIMARVRRVASQKMPTS
ncbi:MAG TPA: hypothetical protein VNS52_07890 [Gemmatimonadaceae bacterium]|nr:hypothetical protein [Gemmatimonadaceae bacterium]